VVCGIVAGTSMARAEDPEATVKRNAAQAACAARDPKCDWLATLSSLERQSVIRALAARGYEIEPSPWGKLIDHVYVFNEEVFAEPTPILEFFNIFHYTTRESAIHDELTTHAGELWSQDLVDESARRLRDPLWSSVVITLPVKSHDPGKVDLLVVTRDVWSIRLNTTYTFQEGSLTNLNISLSENNFLGNRDVVAAALTMDQGAIAMGPLLIDKNVAGKHLNLQARVDDIVTRKDLLDDHHFHSEGTDSTIALSKSLWSLASEWGWGVNFSHRYAIARQFVGTNLRTYDDPSTLFNDALPWTYDTRSWDLSANGVRQWGTEIKHQFSFGYEVDSLHVHPLDSFMGTDQQRADFIRDVLPRNEVVSSPFVGYALFTPWYKTLRNVTTYDLAEDLQLGPSFDVSVGVGIHALGGDYNFARGTSDLAWTFPLGKDGYFRPSTSISLRYRGDTPVARHDDVTFIDNQVSGTMRVVTPTVGYGRIVAQSTIASRWNDTQNAILGIGSDSGLRGFSINQFLGQRVLSTLVEARTIPWSIWVLRLGGVLFWDSGGAADSLATMTLHNDVGAGFRMLIPQTSRQLFRFDLAFPLDGLDAGHPHFIASFDSYF
jgi:outer membrane protein assembly factor BamA